MNSDNSQKVLLGSLALALTGGAVFLYQKQRKQQKLEGEDYMTKEDVLRVMKKLSVNFHGCCRELTDVAQSVLENLKAKGLSLDKQQLKHQLQEQGGVLSKLEEVQRHVLQEEGIRPEQLQYWQEQYLSDPEIRDLAEGLDTMVDESLEGTLISPISVLLCASFLI